MPEIKLNELRDLIHDWSFKKRAKKVEIQSLCGKLNWAARVVRGGRNFLRRIIDLSCAECRPHHYIKITADARDDIEWWRLGLSIFHGSSVFPVDVQIPSHEFSRFIKLCWGLAVRQLVNRLS